KGRDGHAETLHLPAPRAESANRADDIELLERAARILAPTDGRHRVAQVGDENHFAGGGVPVGAEIDANFRAAHRHAQRHALPILVQSSGNPRSVPVVFASVYHQLWRIDRGTTEVSSVNVLPRDGLGQGEPVTPTQVIPIIDVK